MSAQEFTLPRGYLPGFEIHAAPEAIQAHIEKARARSIEIQNELGWLEGLLLRRITEGWAINSACLNHYHDRCPGETYVGHAAGRPVYVACQCSCHSDRAQAVASDSALSVSPGKDTP